MQMKLWIVKLIVLGAFLLGWSATQQHLSHAASCSGSSCDGLNPDSAGCSTGAYTSGTYKTLPDNSSRVETRVNTSCNAKWARVTNYSGAYRYAAGSVRYGCANYCYSRSVSSPGTIANNAAVYTSMIAYSTTPTRSCGKVETTGPISVPIALSDTYCTSAN
jgi:hypothetical protein